MTALAASAPLHHTPSDALRVAPAAIRLIHADDAMLVVAKPAGLPSVPGKPVELHDCVASRLQAQWPDALIVHRLDMPTSGLMVFA
ncbi:MAG: pseudouridine synthase, partial [Leptothrix sp. (in: b-proteobacteria)]